MCGYRSAVAPYLALFAAGFRRQSAYRLALVSGLATNAFFGFVRTALFLALYRQRGDVAGLELSEALTYVWLMQSLFAVVFAPWLWEYAERIRSGDVVVDLLRPGDPLGRLLATDLGRTANMMLVRSTVPLLGAGLVLDLDLPTTVLGVVALLVSAALTAVAGFELRFLFGSTAFWTADFKGVFALLLMPVWFLAGFLIPTDYFPRVLQVVADLSPLSAMVMSPFRVAIGDGVATSLALQVSWVAALLLGCRAVLAAAERRMVVHGG